MEGATLHCYHMKLHLRIVALYAKVILYGTTEFLAYADRNGLAATIGHLALGRSASRENLSVSESAGGRVF